jgi:quercetin dioxygenase-like cupin family protein
MLDLRPIVGCVLAGAAPLIFSARMDSRQAIPVQELGIAGTGVPRSPGASVREVLRGEVEGVETHVVSIAGPARHQEPGSTEHEVVWLFLRGKGLLTAKDMVFDVSEATIARAPLGWAWEVQVAEGEALHALRVRKRLHAADRAELGKFPENNAGPYVRKFRECPPYEESIKSRKTVSRTLLPENYVPRVAMGTVETSGPDEVAPHRHPMLEQLFVGLEHNDITVVADGAKASLTPFSILHIPLGSNHGVEVAAGKKLHYVWMDFFLTKEGQDWLQMHKPVTTKDVKPPYET